MFVRGFLNKLARVILEAFISPVRENTPMSTPKCKITWREDGPLGWKLNLKGDCEDTLQAMENLPPRRRRYLARRLEIEE